MRDKIYQDMVTAMKAKEKDKVIVLKMIRGIIQNEELNLKREMKDDEVIRLISKEVKTRQEAILEFEKGNRQDLVELNLNDIKILNNYLPAQLTDEEASKIIDDAFINVNPTSIKDMGKLMGILTPKFNGVYDMGKVSKVIKEKLN